jgi:hypothetical protein
MSQVRKRLEGIAVVAIRDMQLVKARKRKAKRLG